ncbi:uncharacterized protein C22orf15-like [Argonauta hians]
MSQRIFITLKYGDNESIIANPNCSIIIFTEWIKKTCNYKNDHENGMKKYTSLLDNLDKLHPDLYNKLESLSGNSKTSAKVGGSGEKSRKSGKTSKRKSAQSPNVNHR